MRFRLHRSQVCSATNLRFLEPVGWNPNDVATPSNAVGHRQHPHSMEGEAILQVKIHCCFSPLLPWLRCIWRAWMSRHWSSRCLCLSSACVFFQPPSSPRNLSNTVCNQHPTRPSASAFFLRAYSPLHAFFIRFHLAPTFAILHCGLYGNVLYHSFTLGKCFKSFLQSPVSVERACVHITATALSYSNPHGSGAADRLIRCEV